MPNTEQDAIVTTGAEDSIDCAVSESNRAASSDKRIGRPTKTSVLSKTKGHIAKRGRPPGEAAAMAAFKARLVNSPKSRKVIDTIINAALDDNHKNQSAAWKILADRILPLSQFEKGAGGNKSAITINISGLGEANISATPDDDSAIEGQYDVEEDEEEQ